MSEADFFLNIPHDWALHLKSQFKSDYFKNLIQFIESEEKHTTIFPPRSLYFNAFKLCHFKDIKVVLIGQDPYHGAGQANGLCFGVNDQVPLPPSLRNIFKEIQDDIGTPIPTSGDMSRWAIQGILLLNTILTVREGKPGSHRQQGWEIFTDYVIHLISQYHNNIVFLLWGAHALKKKNLIDPGKHYILESPHPSPLSAYRGFFGNKHFSKTNEYLKKYHKKEIIW